MSSFRAQLLTGVVCLVIGATAVTQLHAQRSPQEDVQGSSGDQSTLDQAASTSRLYASNDQLRGQVSELSTELDRSQKSSLDSKATLDSKQREMDNLLVADGEVEVVGPGVTVTADGNLTVFQLQDLVNELRNSAAEALAVNSMRIVARSSIVSDQDGRITIDRRPVARPYHLDAIGDPATLGSALKRKGGLIALLEADNPGFKIEVVTHSVEDHAGWVRLPKTALDFAWVYGQPAP